MYVECKGAQKDNEDMHYLVQQIIKSEHGQDFNPESWPPHQDEMVEDVHLEHDYTFLVLRMIN